MSTIISQHKTFVKYLIVGIGTNIFNYICFLFLNFLINIDLSLILIELKDYQIAESITFLLANILNFFWHKRWTFQSNEWDKKEVVKFTFLQIVNYFAGIGILTIGIEWFNIPEAISKLIMMALVVGWNFLILKLLIFRQ